MLHQPLSPSSSRHLNALGVTDSKNPPPPSQPHDPTLIDEQLARNQAFLGKEGLDQIRQAHVVVVGTGSVGSWAALMLARSGVQHLRLIDPANIEPHHVSSHAAATPLTIGRSKVSALQAILAPIVPFVDVDPVQSEWQPRHIMDMVMEMSKSAPTSPTATPPLTTTLPTQKSNLMVVDCLGTTSLDAKVKLIQFCHTCGIPIISALDPGNKVDPTRIQLTDISDTFDDPSATLLRRRLKQLGVDRNLPVAYSTEKPTDPKYTTNPSQIHRFQNSVLPDARSRHTPIIGAISAMYGMTLTTYTLLHLANFSAYQVPACRLRDKHYQRIHEEVRKREQTTYNNMDMPLSVQDVEYIYEEIWHGKSVLTGPQERTTLARWNRSKPLSLTNAVCLSKDEARAHDQLPHDTNLTTHYGQDVVDFVEKQIAEQIAFEYLWK
ncbi:hypothetical protein DM01DRAFT_1331316 [Hesseltinella vesiculosa]|uniref:THIF-type NAD/FAD binding fold domain-containing protein n=1 Tax=Hesseltinella vesiculosa TaxID=101127 RepID=A0A1X2GUY3_9FUNG|nr:hypothetical protein DM01DRAFT_1331316 [Hesseltinella vesiculosa]